MAFLPHLLRRTPFRAWYASMQAWFTCITSMTYMSYFRTAYPSRLLFLLAYASGCGTRHCQRSREPYTHRALHGVRRELTKDHDGLHQEEGSQHIHAGDIATPCQPVSPQHMAHRSRRWHLHPGNNISTCLLTRFDVNFLKILQFSADCILSP